MDDLMARTMVENLSIGIDPITGRVLPKYDSCANEVVQEALRTVLDNCSLESYGTILEKQRAERADHQKTAKKGQTDKTPFIQSSRSPFVLLHAVFAASSQCSFLPGEKKLLPPRRTKSRFPAGSAAIVRSDTIPFPADPARRKAHADEP